jgi:hypothetical protein
MLGLRIDPIFDALETGEVSVSELMKCRFCWKSFLAGDHHVCPAFCGPLLFRLYCKCGYGLTSNTARWIAPLYATCPDCGEEWDADRLPAASEAVDPVRRK